ncbi:MAG: Transcriptional regulator [Sphingomonas bacterium]|uniref:GntR family transcriptional regulator n=1 Tax=Sphingomonas bacterium TaxID=1895847 RepID=UPI0026287F64|nr:GntR family transcriptional regulator [Sphingomonas bacterium]MDB5707323.1 Transcriptional regulator [Sphingomonas bacterium]
MSDRLADRVARRIVEHIRTRALPEGAHLVAQELADLFKVSRAPVTAALRALEQSGAVRSVPNRGFFVGTATPDAVPLADGGEDDEDGLYNAIVDQRLDETLPAKVSENELMRHFGVTRARLQRTLAQIADEGWVERLPGHGWQFSTTLHTAESYEQAYRFRGMIETQALLQPGYAVVPEDLVRLRAEQQGLLSGTIEALPRARLFELNSGFHETIVAWSGNPFFLDSLKRINRLRRLIEFRVTGDRSRLDQQCREHLALLDLLERGDILIAAEFLRGHIGHALAVKERAVHRLTD